jgi:hypothetical protein
MRIFLAGSGRVGWVPDEYARRPEIPVCRYCDEGKLGHGKRVHIPSLSFLHGTTPILAGR